MEQIRRGPEQSQGWKQISTGRMRIQMALGNKEDDVTKGVERRNEMK